MVAINDRRERKEILPDVAKRMSLNRFFEAQRDVVNDELESLVPDLIEDALENPTGSYQRTNNKIMYRLDTINKNTKLIKKDTDEILTFLKKDLQDKLDELSDGQGGGLLGSIMSMFGLGAAAGTGKSLFSRLRGGSKTPEISKTPTATPDKTGRFRVKDLPPEEQQKFLEKGRKPSDFIKNTEAEAAGLTTKAETAVAKSESTLSKLGSKISGFFKSAVGEISAGTSRLLKIGGKLLKPLAIAAVIYKAWDDISKLKRPPEVDATVYRQNIEKVLLMLIAELGFTIVGAAIGTLVVGGATGGVAALAGTIIGLGAGIALDVYLGDDAADLINNKTFISMVDSVVSYFISSDEKKDDKKDKKDALNKTAQIIKNTATSDPYKNLSDEELAAKGLKRAGVVNGTRYSAAQNLYEITGPAAGGTQPPNTPDSPKPPDAQNALDAQELTLAETLQVLHASPKLTDENTVMALARKMFPGRKYSLLEKAIAEFLKLHPDGLSQATPFTEGVESSLAAAAGSGSYLAAKQMAADTAAGILPSTAAAPGAATSTAAASTMPYAVPQPGMAAAGPPAGGVTRSEGGGGKAPTYYQGGPVAGGQVPSPTGGGPQATAAPATAGTQGLEPGSRNELVKKTYDAFINAGYSHNQALALTAEVGRENSFSSSKVFGMHIDPANGAVNAGFFSWQGDRGKALMKRLGEKGLLNADGTIVQGQEALNEMAAFSKHELETNPEYSRTKDQFLGNPNIDPQAAAQVVGENYIKWRINDPKYRDAGLKNRSDFLNIAENVAKSSGTQMATSTEPGADETAALAPSATPTTGADISAKTPNVGPGGRAEASYYEAQLTPYDLHAKTRENSISGMNIEMKARLGAMFRDAPDYVKKELKIQSAFRDQATQNALKARAGSSPYVATKSQHSEGMAVDLGSGKGSAEESWKSLSDETKAWVMANSEKYGLYRPMQPGKTSITEDWHFEPIGNRSDKPNQPKADMTAWQDPGLAMINQMAQDQSQKPPAAQPVQTVDRDRMAPPPVAEVPVVDQVGEKVSSLLEDYRSPPPASLVTPTPGPQQGPSQGFLAMASAQQRISSQIYGLPIGNFSKDPSKATIDATYSTLAGETGVLS